MYQIQNITQDPKQSFTLNIPGSDPATLLLEYLSTQQGWFMTITQGTFQSANIRLGVSVNALRQFKNILQFGLSCISNDKQDPMLIDSFTNGQSTIYFLESSDVTDLEATFYG